MDWEQVKKWRKTAGIFLVICFFGMFILIYAKIFVIFY